MRECQLRPSPTAQDLMREAEVLIPLGMSVGAAGGLLNAVGAGVAPVVDYRGRCVGVFTDTDYQRWVNRAASEAEPALERFPASGISSADEVRYHITGQFAPVALDAPVQELLHRLDGGTDPFLIVIDRQARPRGIVCALDVLMADSECTRAGTALTLAELKTGEWQGANRDSTPDRMTQFRAIETRQPSDDSLDSDRVATDSARRCICLVADASKLAPIELKEDSHACSDSPTGHHSRR